MENQKRVIENVEGELSMTVSSSTNLNNCFQQMQFEPNLLSKLTKRRHLRQLGKHLSFGENFGEFRKHFTQIISDWNFQWNAFGSARISITQNISKPAKVYKPLGSSQTGSYLANRAVWALQIEAAWLSELLPLLIGFGSELLLLNCFSWTPACELLLVPCCPHCRTKLFDREEIQK